MTRHLPVQVAITEASVCSRRLLEKLVWTCRILTHPFVVTLIRVCDGSGDRFDPGPPNRKKESS